MDVIRHQAEGQQAEPEAPAIVRQPLEIHAAVLIVTEDQTSVVASDGDVVNGPGQLKAKRARHRRQ
jgi:hypothetical protein